MGKSKEHEGMDNNYDNETTRAIDAQIVIAPQYGMGGIHPTDTDPTTDQPKNKWHAKRHTHRKQPRYDVRKERTRDLKLHMAILRAELECVRVGKLRIKPAIVEAMQARLKIMSEEKTRRDLHNLAGGKIGTHCGFLSLGARLRAA